MTSPFYDRLVSNYPVSSKKDGELGAEAERLTQQTIRIKANIKLVICGLKELQNINVEGPRPPNRDIFA